MSISNSVVLMAGCSDLVVVSACSRAAAGVRTCLLHSKGKVVVELLVRSVCSHKPFSTTLASRNTQCFALLSKREQNLGDAIADSRQQLFAVEYKIATTVRCPQQVGKVKVHDLHRFRCWRECHCNCFRCRNKQSLWPPGPSMTLMFT